MLRRSGRLRMPTRGRRWHGSRWRITRKEHRNLEASRKVTRDAIESFDEASREVSRRTIAAVATAWEVGPLRAVCKQAWRIEEWRGDPWGGLRTGFGKE